MKKGIPLAELAIELKRQNEAKVDYLADTRHIAMGINSDGRPAMLLEGVYPGVADQENLYPHPIRDIAHRQMGQYAGIHASYYDKMRTEAPALLAANVNHWLHDKQETKLVRVLDGNMRAMLSKTYRPLDNFDCLAAVFPVLDRNDLNIHSCEITERKLYIKAVSNSREVEVKADGAAWGDGGNNTIHTLRPGIVISNSETGFSSVSIKPAIHDMGCTNLTVFSKDTARKIHVQSATNVNDSIQQYIKDDTKRAADAVFWKTIKDLTEAALEGGLFDKYCDDVRVSMGLRIEKPIETVRVVAKDVGLTDDEATCVINALITSGEPTKFGLQAAITNVSQMITNYDRASELEEIGGRIIELNPAQWSRIEAQALAA